jgi:transcription elongation GreA/GreB family factor
MSDIKTRLWKQLQDTLALQMEGWDRSVRSAHEEAIHEQSKSEGKYDTRATEASYLAEGQARQAAELARAALQLADFVSPDFGPGDPIALGALVLVQGARESAWHWMVPCAGGTELTWEQEKVLVLTPQSPLGQQLMGRKVSDRFTLVLGREKAVFTIARVL